MTDSPVNGDGTLTPPEKRNSNDPENTAASGEDRGITRSRSVSKNSESNMCFAVRPTASGFADKSNFNQPMILKANSYRFKMTNTKMKIQKYALGYTPELPDNSKVNRQVTKACRDKLKDTFGNYMVFGNFLFTTKMFKDPQEFDSEHDGQTYKVEVKWTKCVNDDELEFGQF